MPSRPTPRLASVCVLLIIFYLSIGPENPSQLISLGNPSAGRWGKHRNALSQLRASSWGDFSPPQTDSSDSFKPSYLNLTGFREADGFAWDDLDYFRQQCRDWSLRINSIGGDSTADDPLQTRSRAGIWQNATGLVKGHWVRRLASSRRGQNDYNLTRIAPDYTWRGTQFPWLRNITGDEGKIALDMIDTGPRAKELDYETAGRDDLPSGSRIRTARASVEIEDVQGSGSPWELRLYGVQWPRTGVILMTTTSQKFDGIFALPHLTPGLDFFQSSQKLLNETLSATVQKEAVSIFGDVAVPWSSDPANDQHEALRPSPHCEFVLFAQVHPIDKSRLSSLHSQSMFGSMPTLVDEIERELRFPTGSPIGAVPALQMSAILWSPDCGFFIETKGPPAFAAADGRHMVGNKMEVIYGQIRFWGLAFACIIVAQLFLLLDQMKDSPTPSTLCRISHTTIGMMAAVDVFVFGGAGLWVLEARITYLESLALMFTSLLSATIGYMFLVSIRLLQEPLDRIRTGREAANGGRAPQQATETPAAAVESSQRGLQGAEGAEPRVEPMDGDVPPPAPASRPERPESPPIIIPSDQDIDAEIAGPPPVPTPNATGTTPTSTAPQCPAIVVISVIMLSVVFLAILSTTWPSHIRSAFVNSTAFLYLSMWIPQIHRNVMRNCRRALSWRFMIGQSLLRLAPLAYFYLKEDNFFLAEPDPRTFLVFCAWLWAQLWILGFQDVLGPRFGIPKGWAPEAWDYHPVLREDNLEDGSFPVGLLSSLEPVQADDVKGPDDESRGHKDSTVAADEAASAAGPARGMRNATTECAICFEVLEVPVVRAGEAETSAGGVAGALTRRAYMVTPCRHVFHSECLESWLRYRLKCPICRDDLPPL